MAESILDASEEQLKLAQAKITYLGEQKKPIPTVVFFAEGYRVALDRFCGIQQSGKAYTNDVMPYTMQFSVTPAEFRRMLSSIKPILTKPDVAKGRSFIAFSVVRETGSGFEGQEFRVSTASGEAFYEELISALDPQNEAGRRALSKQFRNVYPKEGMPGG